MLLNFKQWVLRHETIIVLVCAVILVRVPTLFEPYWYGDEGIYLTIGQSLREGVKLYSEIHDNKPPLLYWMAALASGREFDFKFVTAAWNIANVIVFYLLALKLFKKTTIASLTSLVFAFFTNYPKLEGNIANAELYFLLPLTLATYLLVEIKSSKHVFAAGIAIGVAGLFKMPALVEICIWPLTWLAIRDSRWFKHSLILTGGTALALLLSWTYFVTQGTAVEYIRAAWLQNLFYVSSWKTTQQGFGLATLSGRAVLAGILILPILIWGRKLGRLGSWFWIGSICNMFAVNLSARPYPHYLLQATLIWALVIIWGFQHKGKALGVLIILFLLWTGLIKFFGFYNYPVVGYYRNFWYWATKRIDTDSYYKWFGARVVENYEVAKKVQAITKTEEKIFVWGDEPMIYAISRRSPIGKYTAKYHIKDFAAEAITLRLLEDTSSRVIISYGSEDELPGLRELLQTRYKEIEHIGHARIFQAKAQVDAEFGH